MAEQERMVLKKYTVPKKIRRYHYVGGSTGIL